MFNKKEAFLIQKPIISGLVFLFLGFLTVGGAVYANTPGKKGKSPPPSPTDLETEGLTNPTGVIDQTPEFSATYNDPESGNIAEYYRIQVKKSRNGWGRLVWDSNKTPFTSQLIKDNWSEEIPYGGSPLALDDTKYFWRIKFWDDKGNERAWSKEVSYFKMALGTTVRFYAGTGDGSVELWSSGDWGTTHDAATGQSANYSNDTTYAACGYQKSEYFITRVFFPIDTSDLPDDAIIASSTLYIYFVNKLNYDNDGDDYLTIVDTYQAANTSLITADYEDCGSDNGTAGRAKDIPIEGIEVNERKDLTDLTTGTYTAFTLNATGRSWISTTAYTNLGMREGHDSSDNACDTSEGSNLGVFRQADYAGTDYDPYLEVTYVVP